MKYYNFSLRKRKRNSKKRDGDIQKRVKTRKNKMKTKRNQKLRSSKIYILREKKKKRNLNEISLKAARQEEWTKVKGVLGGCL